MLASPFDSDENSVNFYLQEMFSWHLLMIPPQQKHQNLYEKKPNDDEDKKYWCTQLVYVYA